MNILLLDGLPTEIDGTHISPDFRNMIQFDIALHEEKEEDAILFGLNLLYPGFNGEVDEDGQVYPMPQTMQKAVEGLMWFFRRGKKPEEGAGKAAGRAYDFNQDAGMMLASFREAYGINLSDGEFMHWWEFLALLEGLPGDTSMARAAYYRTVDTNGMSKSEKEHVNKMKKVFAIKQDDMKPLTAEELEQQTKDRIKRRMAQVRKEHGQCTTER